MSDTELRMLSEVTHADGRDAGMLAAVTGKLLVSGVRGTQSRFPRCRSAVYDINQQTLRHYGKF